MSTYEDGYREGYKSGFADGFTDGSSAGYANAKERAYNALQNISDKGMLVHTQKKIAESIEQQLGKRFT